jgi:hypothetical protein
MSYQALAGGNSAFCFLFHLCSWEVVSVLRYLFIIHEDWIDSKFPGDAVTLNFQVTQ